MELSVSEVFLLSVLFAMGIVVVLVFLSASVN